ncbi:MAG: hypothetical protein ABSA78_00600 [Candidatus Sulfotelmatobacter sp.]
MSSSVKGWFYLLAEMPHAGEQNRQTQPVGGGDDFGVALRAAELNDGGRPASAISSALALL